MHLEDLPLAASAEALTIDVERVTASATYLVAGMIAAMAAASDSPEHHHSSETSSITSVRSAHAGNQPVETAPAPPLPLSISTPRISGGDSAPASTQESEAPHQDDGSLSPSNSGGEGTTKEDASPPPLIDGAPRPLEEGDGSGVNIPSEAADLGQSEQEATVVGPSRASHDVGGERGRRSSSEAELKPEESTARGDSIDAVGDQADLIEAWERARAMEASVLFLLVVWSVSFNIFR